MENNNEENVVENKSVEVKHCDKEFHHSHCSNNNTLTIVAIILSVVAIGMSSYTLGSYSNNNVRVKNNAKQSMMQEQIATTGNTKRCPMWNQNFDGELGTGCRNFAVRNRNNENFSGPRFNNQGNRNSSRKHLRNNSNKDWVDNNGWNFDGNNWRNFNSNFMDGWRNRNFNNYYDNNNNNGNNNLRNNNSRSYRRNNNNQNNAIEPGSLPKINGNDQAPNTRSEDIKQPLPIPPMVDVR